MAVQSLYRRYRSQRFSELVGQDHVTRALRNAVREGKVSHAYLLSGPRGTGKTTTGRLLAKALNCLDLGDDGEPCGVCANCVAITDGRFLDLFELDAASNNSVDDVRALTERVSLGLGANSSMKVYLVDEVHMLSTAASNALLKTLEEPPAHVVFVLATTNPEKVLPTIRSRTQHFTFRLLDVDELTGHLTQVLASEGVEADPAAVEIIAQAAGGSARDALSLLDQALAMGTGRLEAGAVRELFGRSPTDGRLAVLDAVQAGDPAGALVAVHELLDAGFESRRVAEDLLAALRDAFVLHAAAGRVRVDLSTEDVARLADLGARLGDALAVRAIETLGQAVVDMRGTDAADPRLVLEVALVRVAASVAGAGSTGAPPTAAPPAAQPPAAPRAAARPVAPPPPTAPAAHAPAEAPASAEAGAGPRRALGALRKAATSGGPAAPPTSQAASGTPSASASAAEGASSVGIDEVVLAWAGVLEDLPVPARNAVQSAQPVEVRGDVLHFAVAPALMPTVRSRFRDHAQTVREALAARVGTSFSFKLDPDDRYGDACPPGPASAAPAGAPADAEPPDAEPPGDPGPMDDPGPGDPGPPDDGHDDEMVDPAELVDVPPGTVPADKVGLLVEAFDASVVEERPRE